MTETKPYSFYKILPDGRFEFFVDASLLKSLSLCEFFFKLKHIDNLRPKGPAKAIPFAMAIGSWWSEAMEMFYNAMRQGTPLSKQAIQGIAVTCWANKDIEASVQMNPERFAQFGGLAGSVLMLQEYYDSQYLTDAQNWRIIGVEEGFGFKKEILVGETNQVVVYWVGKPDLVVVENNQRLVPVDHKTVEYVQGKTISLYKPSSQMCGYVHSCETIARQLGMNITVDRAIINICSRKRPSDKPRDGKKKPRFIRAYPNYNKEEVAEWKRQVVSKCERIRTCIRTNTWNWAETQCHSMYHRDCEFVKAHSVAPATRDIIMPTDFVVGEPWRPYKLEDIGEDE